MIRQGMTDRAEFEYEDHSSRIMREMSRQADFWLCLLQIREKGRPGDAPHSRPNRNRGHGLSSRA